MTKGEHIRAILPAADWELLEPFLIEAQHQPKGRTSTTNAFVEIYAWNRMARQREPYQRACHLFNSLCLAEDEREQQATPLT